MPAAIRADAVDVDVVRHIVDNNLIDECELPAMRRIAIDSGAHRVTCDRVHGYIRARRVFLFLGEGKGDKEERR